MTSIDLRLLGGALATEMPTRSATLELISEGRPRVEMKSRLALFPRRARSAYSKCFSLLTSSLDEF